MKIHLHPVGAALAAFFAAKAAPTINPLSCIVPKGHAEGWTEIGDYK